MQKYGGTLWAIGSVAWQFKEQGVMVIDGISETVQEKGKTIDKVHPLNAQELEERAMELPISDFEVEWGSAIVYADKKDFDIVQKWLEKFHYHFVEADIQFIPENTVTLDEAAKTRLFTLLDMLEEDEDIDHVWHNLGN